LIAFSWGEEDVLSFGGPLFGLILPWYCGFKETGRDFEHRERIEHNITSANGREKNEFELHQPLSNCMYLIPNLSTDGELWTNNEIGLTLPDGGLQHRRWDFHGYQRLKHENRDIDSSSTNKES
jgi:hypothetical protein